MWEDLSAAGMLKQPWQPPDSKEDTTQDVNDKQSAAKPKRSGEMVGDRVRCPPAPLLCDVDGVAARMCTFCCKSVPVSLDATDSRVPPGVCRACVTSLVIVPYVSSGRVLPACTQIARGHGSQNNALQIADVMEMVQQKELFPIIIFSFNRLECEQFAMNLLQRGNKLPGKLDFTTDEEKAAIDLARRCDCLHCICNSE